jgi:hypothetical protein
MSSNTIVPYNDLIGDLIATAQEESEKERHHVW